MTTTDYAAVVVPIIREAGEKLKAGFGKPELIENKGNGAADVVTELDRSTEEFVRDRLADAYPKISFVGEEFGGDDAAEQFWLLDPIDGTAHFVRGNPFCTTMLALIRDGRPVFSVIYNFVTDEMFVAREGRGATKNGEKISVSSRPLTDAYLHYEVDFSKGDNLQRWLAMQEHAILFNTINTGYEFGLVAQGKTEGRICLDAFGGIYDFPAGALLVKEAGGVVRNVGSDAYDFRNFTFTATNPKVYEDLLELELLPRP